LPVPEQIWKEVSIDFMTTLPESDGCTNLMVVTDCLNKDVVLVGLEDITTDSVAEAYMNYVVAYHWLPDFKSTPRSVGHMRGLIPFCQQNPALFVERHISLLTNLLPAGRPGRSGGSRNGIIGCGVPDAMVPWIEETLKLPTYGMQPGAF
jgi:hypothetical protein